MTNRAAMHQPILVDATNPPPGSWHESRSGWSATASGVGAWMLCPEDAQLYDINRLVDDVLSGVLPDCCAKGMPVDVQFDVTIPRVALLIEPVEAALQGAFALCLQDEIDGSLGVRTAAANGHALAIVERRANGAPVIPVWRDVGTLGRVELMVGERVLRSLGGRLRVLRGDGAFQARFELPLAERPFAQPLVFWSTRPTHLHLKTQPVVSFAQPS